MKDRPRDCYVVYVTYHASIFYSFQEVLHKFLFVFLTNDKLQRSNLWPLIILILHSLFWDCHRCLWEFDKWINFGCLVNCKITLHCWGFFPAVCWANLSEHSEEEMCIGSARTQSNRRRWMKACQLGELAHQFWISTLRKETSGRESLRNADFRHWNSGQDCLVTRSLNQRNIRTNEQQTGLRTGDSKEMRMFAMLAKEIIVFRVWTLYKIA